MKTLITRLILLASILIATVSTTIHADQNVPASARETAAELHKEVIAKGLEMGYTNVIVFVGVPHTSNMVNVDSEAKTVHLTDATDALKSAAMIRKVGTNYFWMTREVRKLHYKYPGSGLYHYFIDLQGGGYVKIERMPNGKIRYFEHLSRELLTITYYGEGVCSPGFLQQETE